MNIQINNIVGRVSYKCDVLFRVIDIRDIDGKRQAVLYGEDIRLIADAPFQDLMIINDNERNDRQRSNEVLQEQSYRLLTQDLELQQQKNGYQSSNGYRYSGEYFQIPGRVLHVDGDASYLRKCMDLYQKFSIPVNGIYCSEKEMPQRIGGLLDHYRPDILVVTGHDAYSKSKGPISDINAYRHSKDFVQTVREARRRVSHLDQLIIFAGACQSHFESLIQAGANFASSPSRVNIHALDPVYIVGKISFTPFSEHIHVWDVLRNTLTGEKGLGGIETKGVLRTGLPFKPFQEE
ncbi:sporulation peptidase YabG [Bacillus sp. ISL-4]|uniref:sporulation peptidase YabG n=1 Tax=Bacillus sp. ISL-4 TaxID=2819125 RepID=UPI001BE62575|nr:sporulation peptidase YabG [Bacillus sp. ISL-4]MBT2668217.1 sporulation peptidase YabG [Bacillus sp. ISL-4]MBT2671135.1 sporulation peptidase YabG [Streptomyces sp. ISL-14]